MNSEIQWSVQERQWLDAFSGSVIWLWRGSWTIWTFLYHFYMKIQISFSWVSGAAPTDMSSSDGNQSRPSLALKLCSRSGIKSKPFCSKGFVHFGVTVASDQVIPIILSWLCLSWHCSSQSRYWEVIMNIWPSGSIISEKQRVCLTMVLGTFDIPS